MLRALSSILIRWNVCLLGLSVINSLNVGWAFHWQLLVRVQDRSVSLRLHHGAVHEGSVVLGAHGDFFSAIFQKLVAVDDIGCTISYLRLLWIRLSSLCSIGAAGPVGWPHLLVCPLWLGAPVAQSLVEHILILLSLESEILHLAVLAEGDALELCLVLVLD